VYNIYYGAVMRSHIDDYLKFRTVLYEAGNRLIHLDEDGVDVARVLKDMRVQIAALCSAH
jgi:hypothetical protein